VAERFRAGVLDVISLGGLADRRQHDFVVNAVNGWTSRHKTEVSEPEGSLHMQPATTASSTMISSYAPPGSIHAGPCPTTNSPENISGLKWWHPCEVASYDGPDLFSPRGLTTLLTAVTISGAPADLVLLGL
jgi:hypothetical protein